MTTSALDIARQLIASFAPMVRRDGGALELLDADDNVIRIRYRRGADEACESGACVLQNDEIETMMRETLARRAPDLKLLLLPATTDDAP